MIERQYRHLHHYHLYIDQKLNIHQFLDMDLVLERLFWLLHRNI